VPIVGTASYGYPTVRTTNSNERTGVRQRFPLDRSGSDRKLRSSDLRPGLLEVLQAASGHLWAKFPARVRNVLDHHKMLRPPPICGPRTNTRGSGGRKNRAGTQFNLEGGEDHTSGLEELVTGGHSIEIVERVGQSWGILDVHVGRARYTSTKINRGERKRFLDWHSVGGNGSSPKSNHETA
jgi:hypothetical protein